MQRRVNVRGIAYHNGKILAQTIKHPDGESDYWCAPGGGLELGESLTIGLRREMIEETGIIPVIGRLLFIQQFHDGEKEQLEFFFHIKNAREYEVIDLSATSHGHVEIERTEFIAPATHNLLPAFLQTIDLEEYINGTLPVLITNELK